MNRGLLKLKQELTTSQNTHDVKNLLFSFFALVSFAWPFIRRLLRKLVSYFAMDSFMIDDFDDSNLYNNDVEPTTTSSSSSSLYSSSEPLSFVPFRWWKEARDGMRDEGLGGIDGILYDAAVSWERMEEDGMLLSGPEILIAMRKTDEESEEREVDSLSEGGDYALVSQWMFLRALKWHNAMKNVGNFLAAGDSKQDLFSLQIRLSFLLETNSLIIKISQKDNDAGAFDRASKVFNLESGLLRIWDFSGQTNQFSVPDKKLFNLGGQDEEILLELQLYGMSSVQFAEQSKGEYTSCYGGTHNLGLTGLHNLGNTCFMNSSIQCLAHTEKLVDYFLGDFRKDLNIENPLGMNGKLAIAFGDLLRTLWSTDGPAVAPRMFKSALSGFAPQFSGYNQHDSQEFLAFLLDGLHEDLNRVKCKPYIEVKDDDGRPDEEVANEHWRNHLSRNDSIIVDLCQGQYKSTLVCPVCKKMSITFDPFMYLSLPLPSTTMRTMTLLVMSTDGNEFPVPVTVTVPKFGRFKDLVHALRTACSLPDDESFLVAEIFNNRIIRFLEDPSDSIELIRDEDQLVAYLLAKNSDAPLVVYMHQQEERSYIYSTPSYRKFGIPFVARIPELSNGSQIHNKYLELLSPFLLRTDSSEDYDEKQNSDGEAPEKEDSVLDENANLDNRTDDEFEFFFEHGSFLSKRCRILENTPVHISPFSKPIEVRVTWPKSKLDSYETYLFSVLPAVCKPSLASKKNLESVTLYKCLEAFLKEEPLGPEDMWYCPNCKKHRQASKKLDLWRLPEILVIHLKRFSYNRFLKNKLETFVDFPVDDFDLSSYIAHKNGQVSHRYVLYGVSNHYGGMGTGHYTAFVQHGRHGWYEFNDSSVTKINEERVKTSAAYVLFYKRVSQ